MIRLLSLTLLIILLAGCAPYPRYREYNPVTPEQKGRSLETITSNNFIRFGLILQKYLGRPYKSTSKYVEGMDCSMFTQTVFREFNKTLLPRTAEEQFTLGRQVPYQRLSFADLVFFETERGKISHVGIYIGHNEFMHASTSRGVIISGMDEEYWSRRYRGARRILE